MAMQEAIDLRGELSDYSEGSVDVLANDSWSHSGQLKGENVPDFLLQKMDQEKKILQGNDVAVTLPHIFSHSFEDIIKKLSLHSEYSI